MAPILRAFVHKIGGVTAASIALALAAPAAARAQVSGPAVPTPPPADSTPAAPSPGSPDAAPALPPPSSPPPPVAAPGPDRFDELDQRTRILERQWELARDAAASVPPAPTVDASENGFAITSPDGRNQIRFKGQLQMDGRRFFTSDPTLQSSDTFLLRRVRPIVAGTFLGLTDFYISPDFGNNTVVVIDAYIDVHPLPWLRLRAGKFKGPLGLERLQSDENLVFTERALDSNLTAQREIGLQLWGDIAGGIVHYEGGIYNGNPDNGINDVDSDHAKTFEGRLFLQPFNTEALRAAGRLGIGIAAGTGNEKGSSALTAPNPWLGSFKSFGQQTIFSYLTSTTDATQTVIAYGRHERLNPQLYYYRGPFGLLAEWVREHQTVEKGVNVGEFNNQAGHVTVSGAIGGDVTYEGVKPYRSLDWAHRGLGALEVGLRLGWLEVDSDVFAGSVGADKTRSISKAREYAVGLNWQLGRNVKVMGDLGETVFTGGAQAGNRPTEKVAIGRFQIAF
jgi:phosphate-selective porin OprO and OprP